MNQQTLGRMDRAKAVADEFGARARVSQKPLRLFVTLDDEPWWEPDLTLALQRLGMTKVRENARPSGNGGLDLLYQF